MVFFTALIPIMVLIFLGYILRRTNFLPEETWPGIEKLTYYVLFPCLLVRTLGKQSLVGVPWQSILMVVVVTIMSSAVLLVAFRKLISKDNAVFTSIFQGGVRFNTYIVLAVAQSLLGASGLAMGSVAVGFMIVLINLWCISVFIIWGKASSQGGLPFVRELLGNPLIIACAIGWFLSLSGIGLPFVSGDILEIIGRAALPFGLLAVGAALKPTGVCDHIGPIVCSSLAQFGLKPLVAWAMVHYTGLGGAAATALLIAFMTPTSSSAYILARQLGGDTQTMASIITVQTLLAFALMPILGTLFF